MSSLVLTLLSFLTLESGAYTRDCRRDVPACIARLEAFAEMFEYAEDVTGVDARLLAAIAVKESRLNPFAVGGVGEVSIMQLNPRFLGKGITFGPECRERPDGCQFESVLRAAVHLREMMARCGGVAEALGAYNSGTCSSTRYSRSVLERLATIRASEYQ